MISMIKQIAIERPQNLIKFSESLIFDDNNDTGAKSIEMTTFGQEDNFRSSPTIQMSTSNTDDMYECKDSEKVSNGKMAFCQYLTDIFWKLYSMRTPNPLISTVAKGFYLIE